MRTVTADDGRTLVVHDSGVDAGGTATVLWHHGSPQTGALLDPVLTAARARGLRLVSSARPSYGGSTPRPGRDVVSAAADARSVADALGIHSFATMGASGGGPHALACAALLAERVTAAVCLAGIAPYSGDESWFDGMVAPGGLRAALGGRDARARFAETDEFDEASFVDADWAALDGEWSALGEDAGLAGSQGPDGLIDDDVAFTQPWGFSLGAITTPVLLVQGGRDRVVPPHHAERISAALPRVEVWRRAEDGHVSVLSAVPDALDWVLAQQQLAPQ